MLFLELFPRFMLFLSLLVGARLIVAHREAGRDDDDAKRATGRPEDGLKGEDRHAS